MNFIRLRAVPCQPASKSRCGGSSRCFRPGLCAVRRWAAPMPVLSTSLTGDGHRRGGADPRRVSWRRWGCLFPSRPVSLAALKAKVTKRGRVGRVSRAAAGRSGSVGAGSQPRRCWSDLIVSAYCQQTILYNSFRVSNGGGLLCPAVFNELVLFLLLCFLPPSFTTYPGD